MPLIENIKLCVRGYHVVTLDQLPQWIGPCIYEVEIRGKILTEEDKIVAEQARLVRKIDTWSGGTPRLFAADCAEHVLELYEKEYPGDNRPRNAIKAARDLANGLIDMPDAAAAAVAAFNAANAANAASSAVFNAASAATYAAASAANGDSERKWQAMCLKHHLKIG